ncbi:MAG: hypothetical protein HY785_13475 [Oscillatoriophycideae cyanobacterium NC_groundwater_1537_Pr4_S-0.65um_50_18]|nr:hypothetical protein [Oscillatoriophycideae cyanobacterium NC_groundwater_1537_Pr4_S-0.65um_50_18]
MRKIRSVEVRALTADLLAELAKMQQLKAQIQRVQTELVNYPDRADLLYENFALKLHNFYTGCERIFQLIATELNGGLPSGNDWHRRLLDRMKTEREDRPAVISASLALKLQDYLGFRHVVRSLYGYELDPDRIAKLVGNYPEAWLQFEQEIQTFITWLNALAARLEDQ